MPADLSSQPDAGILQTSILQSAEKARLLQKLIPLETVALDIEFGLPPAITIRFFPKGNEISMFYEEVAANCQN